MLLVTLVTLIASVMCVVKGAQDFRAGQRKGWPILAVMAIIMAAMGCLGVFSCIIVGA
jgi:hypothetical protein